MSILYWIGIGIFTFMAKLFAIVNSKAKQRRDGLAHQHRYLQSHLQDVSKKRILVHCASLGEYEQSLPILRWILDYTDYHIVVSFFSSSGYNGCQLLDNCEKLYLPYDTKSEMEKFISAIRPEKVIIIKNEWWWNLLGILKERKTSTYLVSSTIRAKHYFIKRPFTFFKNGLSAFSAAFVVNENSEKILSDVYYGDIIIAGDTRIDQVINTAHQITRTSINRKTMIHGSVWKSDIPTLISMIEASPEYLHILYPHNLDKSNIAHFTSQFSCQSIGSLSAIGNDKVYVINSMGQLKKDYAQASVAYIGGGFGDGIHNILEAAVFRIPVIFGPQYDKSEEALELVNLNLAYAVASSDDVAVVMNKLTDRQKIDKIKNGLDVYFNERKSATNTICEYIFMK